MSIAEEVASALQDIADARVYDGRVVIRDYAPDSGEYGDRTDPGSPWYEECNRLADEVRAALPDGWVASWDDDDLVIEQEG